MKIIKIVLFLFLVQAVSAQDGSRLWLQYEKKNACDVTDSSNSPTVSIAYKELLSSFCDVQLVVNKKLKLKDGFQIISNKSKIKITSSSEIGLLYGAYSLLRLQQTGQISENMNITEIPKYDLRILNHWDNLDGSVERGYAGQSLWQWNDLPEKLSPRYVEYARANASIGINGVVLNNVNASSDILKHEYLKKVKALADVFRPYGIKVYLSVNFSSPKIIGNLPVSDPLNKDVVKWWTDKAAEIYKLIPDFGGFLVKANSEGQPGPQDFGRTHADGANMLAAALKKHGGIVMWRAFVYNPASNDRAKQAYDEFTPLDGQFADNVIVQVKNGPIDFQPREPFNPLFGAMKKTLIMPEVQITQEYLGQSKHLVFLAPVWQEFLESDTYCMGKGSLIKKITTEQKISAIAGVANIGSNADWCGSDFAQANWYAFGRIAWNPDLTSQEIANEWIMQTFTKDENFVDNTQKIMLASWNACVDYMMPMGLHHLFAWNHHYGPEPWCQIPDARQDWMPKYYHRADSTGLGFDRTANGSNAVAQYCAPMNEQFNNVETCPEEYLLWFHHLEWNYKMKNEKTMWENLCLHYQHGVETVREFQIMWDNAEQYIEKERFRRVQSVLKTQARDAIWWRDACLLYFQSFSKQPFPNKMERPIYELDDLKKIKLNMSYTN
ncbi:MAG: alpha-glucuronidase [Prevotellaceae bacterium]|jgi:alpha-glucuronidase|nr:alpha-glucuronidase [Prevotellaceae bacterium]